MEHIQTSRGDLTAKEIQQYRNIIKTSVVLILMWRLGRPTGASEIARILGINRETAANYLESLSLTGFITRLEARDGYRLSNDGQQLLLQIPGGYVLDETLRTSEIPTFVDAKSSQPLILNVGISDIQNSACEEKQAKNGRMSEIPALNVGISDIREGSEEEESISLIHQEVSSSEPEKPKSGLPSVPVLLAGLSVLRGRYSRPDYRWEPPGARDLGDTTPDRLLAWIVKAYSDRDKLTGPVGLICSRCKAGTPRSLPKDWQERLPREYLAAVGIDIHSEPEIERTPAPEIEEVDESPETELQNAWCAALDMLDLPLSFRRKIETARACPVEWDGQKMTVEVRTPADAEYLAGRLALSVQRALSGVMRTGVEVQFVTGGA